MNIQVAVSILVALILFGTSPAKSSAITDTLRRVFNGDIYDDEHQDVPSHEKAYFDSGPELSDSQVVDLVNDDDDFDNDDVSTILVVYRGH